MFNFLINFDFFEKFFIYLYFIFCFITYFVFVLVTIAIFTLVERKIMAALQKRKGPNVHGIWGILQAFSDGLKLLLKEDFVPWRANVFLFRSAPIFTFFVALSTWSILPFSFNQSYSYSNLGLLYFFALSSIGVYGIIFSGWSSNSKYAFLGSLRSAAQMISYEVSVGFIIITICLICSTLNISKIVFDQLFIWFVIPFFPLCFIFYIACLAETARAPFDLTEAEAELVSGYNVEYIGISFALLFLAEYCNIIIMSTLCVLLFFGGWWPFFGIPISFVMDTFFNYSFIFFLSLKVQLVLILFIWIRVSFPRFRYDQLMVLGWNTLLPFAISSFFWYSSIFFTKDAMASYIIPPYQNIFFSNVENFFNISCYDFNFSSTLNFLFNYVDFDSISESLCLKTNFLNVANTSTISKDDIASYDDSNRIKNYNAFMRVNWQKFSYLDSDRKLCFYKTSNVENLSKIENDFNLKDFEFFENTDDAVDSDSIRDTIFNFDDFKVKSVVLNTSINKNTFFSLNKDCVGFLFDPNFNIKDVYMRHFYYSSLRFFPYLNLPLTSSEIVNTFIYEKCAYTWHYTFSILESILNIKNKNFFKKNFTCFFLYSKYNNLIFNKYAQSFLNIQILYQKYLDTRFYNFFNLDFYANFSKNFNLFEFFEFLEKNSMNNNNKK